MRDLVFITGNHQFYGQLDQPWVSVDTKQLIIYLSKHFNVITYTVAELINSKDDIHDSLVFYSYSQKKNYRYYLTDLVHHLERKGNILVPSYDLLCCHENKGYQELLRKRLSLPSLNANYYSSRDEVDFSELTFPCVIKTTQGARGSGVFCAQSKNEFNNILKKIEPKDFGVKFDLWRRRFFKRKPKDQLDSFERYKKPETRFIIQEFAPNLEFDYRVTYFSGYYYIAKRLNRKGDFRASGSLLSTDMREPMKPLLDYAESFAKPFNTPILAMDVVPYKDTYQTIEFQASHFGSRTLRKSHGCFTKTNDEWIFIPKKTIYEMEISEAIYRYVNNKGIN